MEVDLRSPELNPGPREMVGMMAVMAMIAVPLAIAATGLVLQVARGALDPSTYALVGAVVLCVVLEAVVARVVRYGGVRWFRIGDEGIEAVHPNGRKRSMKWADPTFALYGLDYSAWPEHRRVAKRLWTRPIGVGSDRFGASAYLPEVAFNELVRIAKLSGLDLSTQTYPDGSRRWLIVAHSAPVIGDPRGSYPVPA